MAHLFRVDEFELHVASRPNDQVPVGRVLQQCEQELPELQRAAALVRQALLFHFPCCGRDTRQDSEGGAKFTRPKVPPNIPKSATFENAEH